MRRAGSVTDTHPYPVCRLRAAWLVGLFLTGLLVSYTTFANESGAAYSPVPVTTEDVLGLLSTQQQRILREQVLPPGFDGSISPAKVTALLAAGDSREDSAVLMEKLLPLARGFALAPVSAFHVGALVEGNSGALYLGANLEFAGMPLGFTVHAEQSAINNALLHGESGVRRLAVTVTPCGHCRQFLIEAVPDGKLEITVSGKESTILEQLLPSSFGPAALGQKDTLFQTDRMVSASCPATGTAAYCDAVHHMQKFAWSPYSESLSAVSLVAGTDKRVSGVYIENAAFNPSLSPVLSALDRARFSGISFTTVRDVVLVEEQGARISQHTFTEALVNKVLPNARLKVIKTAH